MSNVGYATLQVIPSMQGIEGRLAQGLAGPMRAAGEKSGTHLATGIGTSAKKSGRGIGSLLASHIGLGFAALGVGSIVKSSVQLEASFSKTLAQIAVATGAPKSAMKGLHDEALRMGAQTVFSANEAADAMLDLGKSGISTRDIMGGGLKNTLTLAAAGSLDLGTAATIAANAMNTFRLHGKDMGKIAAALAGGANASTASVESLGLALGQVGPGAKNAGLSLQETVGVLSAFDQAGIKGSDAGTSLKTMLTRLIPSTTKAKDEMSKLNLSFVDSHGNIDDISTVAQKLQDHLKGLSQAQRNAALQTIFGSDATRAATVLMNDGRKGLEKFIAATRDQGAAQRMAKANMSGTAGALERLKGAAETAKLVLGEALAPTVRHLADYLSSTAIPKISNFIRQMQHGKGAGGEFADALKDVFNASKDIAGRIGDVIGALNGMPSWAKKVLATGVVGGALAVKLKIPSLISGGASLLGKGIGVQKVFETNPAALGRPGGEPSVLKTAEKTAAGASLASTGLALAAFLGAPLGVAIGGYLIPKILKGSDESAAKRNIASSSTGSSSGGGMTLPGGAINFGASENGGRTAAEIKADANAVAAALKSLRAQAKATSFDLATAMEPADAGLRDYRSQLLKLPKQALTKVLTPGAVESVKDVEKLATRFKLTPKQVRTVMRALDFASPQVHKVMRDLAALDKQHPKPKLDADAGPLAGRYRVSKNQLIELGRMHPVSKIGADNRQGMAATAQILRSLGIVAHTRAVARVDVDTALATSRLAYVRQQLDAIKSKTVTVNIEQAGGAHRHEATGGYIYGPGSGTSDSIPAMLSNGEFVVNAAATRRNLALLHRINSQRFAAGGQVGAQTSASPGPSGPMTLHLYDTDGRLMGTMRAVARQEIDDTASFGRTMAGRR